MPGVVAWVDEDDTPPALGLVVDEGRGTLPYQLVHGESFVACAAWALGSAGVDLVDASVPWAGIAEAGRDLVLHDALCPMTPPGFLAECLATARSTGAVVVGTRPVTDTVKVLEDGLVGRTLDREELVALASPLVVPAAVVAGLAGRPPADFVRAVTALRAAGHDVRTLEAPAAGRRVTSPEEIRLLEALTRSAG